MRWDSPAESVPAFRSSVIYPNPTSHILHLVTETAPDLSWCLIDENGKIILQKDIVSDTEEINMDEFPAAIYYLKVMQKNDIQASYKIIKH